MCGWWFFIEKILTVNVRCPNCGGNVFLEKNACLSCNSCGLVVRALNPIGFEPTGFYKENMEDFIFKLFDKVLGSQPSISDDDLVDAVLVLCDYCFEDFEVLFFKKVYDQKKSER